MVTRRPFGPFTAKVSDYEVLARDAKSALEHFVERPEVPHLMSVEVHASVQDFHQGKKPLATWISREAAEKLKRFEESSKRK